ESRTHDRPLFTRQTMIDVARLPSSPKELSAGPGPLLGVAPHHHARHGARAADVVRETPPGTPHLTRARLAPHPPPRHLDPADTARADGVSERLEAAARVDRDVATDGRPPFLGELAAGALPAEAQILRVRDLGPREAVVHLGEVDVLRGDAGHRIGRRGGLLRG